MSNPLHRYHLVLHAIASSLNGLSLPELALVTELPRSTAHRMAVALREIDYVELDPLTGNRSEEHTSELQSLMRISYAVFCLKKKILKKYTDERRHSHRTTLQTIN